MGPGTGAIAAGIAARMLRGLAADASWRGDTIARFSNTRKVMTMSRFAQRPGVLVGAATALVLLVPLVAMQFSDEVDWGVFDFVFAGIFLGVAGLLLEAAVRTPGNIAYRAAAVGIGVAAMAFGYADDAPGLVLFGVLLAGAVLLLELAARTSRNVAAGAAATAIGVAAIVVGNSDDAPGLVLFGLLVIVATVALGMMTVQRSR